MLNTSSWCPAARIGLVLFATVSLACERDAADVATLPLDAVAALATPCPDTLPAPSPTPGHQFPDSLVSVLRANGYCHYFIPEYHDEQRLSNGRGDYGPVAYAWASPVVASHADHTAFDNAWVNVAIVDVKEGDPGQIPPSYAAIGLGPQQNCVYIRHRHTGNTALWEGAVAAPGQADNVRLCNGGSARRVPVSREEDDQNAERHPPVARFVEDPSRRAMIGVKCGNGFCVVGAGALNAIPAAAHASITGIPTTAQWRIKGWFDDQHLAVPDAAGALQILPKWRASIVPDEALSGKRIADFRTRWQPVATVYLPPKTAIPGKYGILVNAEGDTVGYGLDSGRNQFELRARMDAETNTEIWEMRIRNTRFPAGFIRPVKRTDHSAFVTAFGIPFAYTARWRWSDKDELIWVACDLGCCMVENFRP